MRIYNFSAGPSTMPLEVLEKAGSEISNYKNFGLGVMEMSHRSKPYMEIHEEAITLLKELMNIPDDYKILFVQGGASQQFAAVPLNLMSDKNSASYAITGNFAKQAHKEASHLFDKINIIASSEDKNFTYIPDIDISKISTSDTYLHITSNNTIFGTRYIDFPDTKEVPLVSDSSSNILSENIDINKFGIMYAGAQKNIGPSGLTVVIVRNDLLDNYTDNCPTTMKYSTQAESDSMYNTPPTYSIYMAMLMFRWLKDFGGIEEMEKQNIYKSNLLYDYIDNSSFYTNNVEKKFRSLMNIPFITTSKELDEKFVKEATTNNLISLKGHRLVGGMRASIYNAMPIDGVNALIEFMKKFEMENK